MHRLRRAPRFPWSVPFGAFRSAAALWVLLRLLIRFPPLGVHFDGFRVTVVVISVVVGLQLLHARRVNERVFSENLGFSEPLVALIAFVTATAGEVLLEIARSSLRDL